MLSGIPQWFLRRLDVALGLELFRPVDLGRLRARPQLSARDSYWLPVDSCKEGQKGALAAVCTPMLKSASKKHQKLCTSVSEHHV